MKLAIAMLVVAACGGPQQTPTTGNAAGDGDRGVVTDTRTEFEKRLDAACSALGPRLTRCAVDDAKAQLAAGQITQQKYDDDTKPEIQAALTKDWHDRCDRPDKMSSRQLRVLEVCHQAETECAPLLDCLTHLTSSASP